MSDYYTDPDGYIRIDCRTDEEKRYDAIIKLLLIFGGPWIVLSVVLIGAAVIQWVT